MNSYLTEKINQINVEVDRIKNYLWRYGLEENEENYNALKNVMQKKNVLFMKKFLNWLILVE